MHLYYQSPWSANTVVLTSANYYGYQAKIEVGGLTDWNGWLDYRSKIIRQPTGRILINETTQEYARIKGDLSGAWPASTQWTRELIFLKYKYLIVIDNIKSKAGYTHRWLLHSVCQPVVSGITATITNGKGRLFCKTILPVNPSISVLNSQSQPYYHLNNRGTPTVLNSATFNPASNPPERMLGSGRLEVMPHDTSLSCTYLHVLYPTDTSEKNMPACSLSGKPGSYTIHIGNDTFTISDSLLSSEKMSGASKPLIARISSSPYTKQILYSINTTDARHVKISIVSINGRLVHSHLFTNSGNRKDFNGIWNTSNTASGTYLIRIVSDKNQWSSKIVIQ